LNSGGKKYELWRRGHTCLLVPILNLWKHSTVSDIKLATSRVELALILSFGLH
jgi:hypothetical protein